MKCMKILYQDENYKLEYDDFFYLTYKENTYMLKKAVNDYVYIEDVQDHKIYIIKSGLSMIDNLLSAEKGEIKCFCDTVIKKIIKI